MFKVIKCCCCYCFSRKLCNTLPHFICCRIAHVFIKERKSFLYLPLPFKFPTQHLLLQAWPFLKAETPQSTGKHSVPCSMALFICCLKEAAWLFEMLITKALRSQVFQFSNPGFDFHRTLLICLAPSPPLLEARILCWKTKKKRLIYTFQLPSWYQEFCWGDSNPLTGKPRISKIWI